jgi:phosphotransferase system enzyme I (PtsI)
MKKGIAASRGYAIGKVALKVRKEQTIIERKIENIEEEKVRFDEAVEKSRQQLIKIKEKTKVEMGDDKAEVFESHLMLLDDPEFTGSVVSSIESNLINSEKALKDVVDMFLSMFEAMDDEYMRERAADVKE